MTKKKEMAESKYGTKDIAKFKNIAIKSNINNCSLADTENRG